MTKNILLAATATTALAISAFGAQANDLTISVGGVDVSDAPLTIASEAPFSTTALRTANLVATVDYDAATFPAGNNLVITYTLGGGATFGTAVTAANLEGFDDVLLSSGGAAGQNFVTFLVDNANDDVEIGDFTQAELTAKVRFAASGSPTVSVNTTTEANTPIEGGVAAVDGLNTAGTLIRRATGFTVDIDANMVANEATIDSDFETFGFLDTTAELGSVEVDYASDVYAGFVQAAGPTQGNAVTIGAADPYEGADVTIDGIFTNLELVAQPDTTVDGNVITFDADTLGVAVPIELELDGIAASSDYDASVVLDLITGWSTPSAYTGELGEITREGSSYVVPWVSSQTLGAQNSSRNFIRISNESDTAAAVSIEVTASATVGGIAPTFASGIIAAGTVEGGSDLILNSNTLQTLLGGDFRRADIRVIVEADQDVIHVRRQIVQPNGQSTELSVTPE